MLTSDGCHLFVVASAFGILSCYTEKSLGERQHRRRASSANVTLVLQRAHFGLATRRLWARSAPIMLALEVCATACHTADGLRARTERAVRLTYESAVLSSIGYPGGLHRIAVRPTTFPCIRCCTPEVLCQFWPHSSTNESSSQPTAKQ